MTAPVHMSRGLGLKSIAYAVSNIGAYRSLKVKQLLVMKTKLLHNGDDSRYP